MGVRMSEARAERLPSPSTIREAMDALGGRAVPVARDVAVVSGHTSLRMTVKLDAPETDPPTFASVPMDATAGVGKGWRVLPWGDLRKVEDAEQVLNVLPDEVPDFPTWAFPPAVKWWARVDARNLSDVLQRFGSVARAAITFPSLRCVRFVPVDDDVTDVLACSGYQVAAERQYELFDWSKVWHRRRTFEVSAAAVEPVLKVAEGEVRFGTYGHETPDFGYALGVGGTLFWHRVLNPWVMTHALKTLRSHGHEPVAVLTTSALALRKHARQPPLVDPCIRGFEWVTYQGTLFQKSYLANVGKHLRGEVQVNVPSSVGAPWLFTDEYGAWHYLMPARLPDDHMEHLGVAS